MRKAALISTIASVPLLFAATFASADQLGTAAEAKAMLDKAVAELKADMKGAIDKFKKGEGGYKDRDLYVFCFNTTDGKFTAHPSLVGKDIRTLKDKSGALFGQKIFDSAKEGSVTTVEYMFPKPGGTEPVAKESYITKVGDQGCAVGYYK